MSRARPSAPHGAPGRGRLVLVPPATRADPPADPVPALLRDLLGARLRRARQAQGRSLRDVGAAAGVSPGHLSQVERGLAEASSEVLAALCRALGVPLHVLLRAVAVDLTGTPAPSGRVVTSLTALAPAPPSARRPGDGVQALAA